jgi:hypothetical protein
MRTSSPTLTTAVTSAPTARAWARTPTRNFAPPMPPVRTTIRIVTSSRTPLTEVPAGYPVPEARPVYAGPTLIIIRQGDSVTSQPQPPPGEGRTAGQQLRPLRDLAAYALVGATAVLLLVAIIRLIPDGGGQFSYRTQGSFGGFINLATITFPIAAVLLSLLVLPRHQKAQLIVLVAVIEYAVMAVFGLLFGVLIGLINEADHNGARSAFEGLLERVAWLAVFAVAAYAVYLIWRNLFYTPRPKPQPGVYGQPPQYGQPGYGPPPQGYAGPPPGHPGQPHPGQPHPGQPHPGQPQPGQPQPGGQYGQYGPPPQGGYPPAPGMYGQPAPTWNQPPTPMPTAAPNQSPPDSPPPGAPSSGVPASGVPAGDATQIVPPVEARSPEAPAEEKTQKIDDRPGFGPAEQDPPRHQ